MTISDILELCISNNLIFYCFRLPHANDIFTGIQLTNKVSKISALSTNKRGFVVAPFHTESNEMMFIEPDIFIKNEEITEIEFLQIKNTTFHSSIDNTKSVHVSKEEYLQQANFLIDLLKQRSINKVILSRTEVNKPVNNADTRKKFSQLIKTHPHAFVSMFHLPDYGTWLGATPETLVSIENNYLKTMSLAATKSRNKNEDWSPKEIEEQKMVSDFVSKVLTQFPFESIKVSETKDYDAGPISHLVTNFECFGNLSDNELTKLVFELHPTPAVCGIPKQKSLEIILKTEIHDRELYAGFIGPIGEGSTQLFVNLRCMKLTSKSATYFAGGGLTAQSDAEAEWEETCLKMKTLR